MNKAFIKAIDIYTPKNIISNSDIIKDFPEWSEKKISLKIGINQRFISGEMTAGDMGIMAAENLFNNNKIDRNQIDVLLFCTQSPDYYLPTTACIMQDRLKLPTSVAAFDYNLGCSGFAYGLGIAKSMIVSGMAENVLLITAETYQKHIHKTDRGNRALFSDAAAATLISSEGWAEIGNVVYGTDGSGYDKLIVKAGGARMPKTGIEPSSDTPSPDYLYMDGPSIFNFTLEVVPKLVNDILNKNNLNIEDIDLYVFHQANKHMLKFIREAINIPEEKFYMCLENYGNTVSSTIPIALFCAYKEGLLKPGQKIMTTGFGVGLSWAGEILLIK